MDFGQTRFTAITFWAVMEHLANPLDFLKKPPNCLTWEDSASSWFRICARWRCVPSAQSIATSFRSM
jgi:hypothetical protein